MRIGCGFPEAIISHLSGGQHKSNRGELGQPPLQFPSETFQTLQLRAVVRTWGAHGLGGWGCLNWAGGGQNEVQTGTSHKQGEWSGKVEIALLGHHGV